MGRVALKSLDSDFVFEHQQGCFLADGTCQTLRVRFVVKGDVCTAYAEGTELEFSAVSGDGASHNLAEE